MNALSATLGRIRNRKPERQGLLDHELLSWTLSVRALLKWTDSVLDRLEGLNVRGEARAPRDLEEIARLLLQPVRTTAGGLTVQELIDGVLAAQEPILFELGACRTERIRRAGGVGAVALTGWSLADGIA